MYELGPQSVLESDVLLTELRAYFYVAYIVWTECYNVSLMHEDSVI